MTLIALLEILQDAVKSLSALLVEHRLVLIGTVPFKIKAIVTGAD